MTGPRAGTAAAVLLVLAALTLVVLGSRSQAPRFSAPTSVPQPPVVAITPTATGSGGVAGPQATVPHNAVFEGFSLFMFILVVVLLVAGVVLAFPRSIRRPSWRRYRTMRGVDAGERAGRIARSLAEAVDDGLREVERGDVADAIVACWLRLEDAAADAGTARRTTDTAGDLTGRVLAAHRVTPGTLRRLADLYREARFSHHRLGEAERDQARAALEQVRAELTERHGVPAGPAASTAAAEEP